VRWSRRGGERKRKRRKRGGGGAREEEEEKISREDECLAVAISISLSVLNRCSCQGKRGAYRLSCACRNRFHSGMPRALNPICQIMHHYTQGLHPASCLGHRMHVTLAQCPSYRINVHRTVVRILESHDAALQAELGLARPRRTDEFCDASVGKAPKQHPCTQQHGRAREGE
jgi:hypothetical protein